MNKVFLIGRLTKDPQGDAEKAIRYTLAVDGYNDHTDYISCVCFNKTAEFAKTYLTKGTKVAVEGRILTGSYEKDGVKVYTTDVVVERHEFCESKRKTEETSNEGYIPDIPDLDKIEESLPFK